TSPIYVHQERNVRISGQVVDGVTGDPVDGAAVELCRTDGVAVCVSRSSLADGTFPVVESLAGTWTARAFPPAGVTNRGYASASIGRIAPGVSRSVTLTLPAASDPYIDPAGRVVDTEGAPISGASVQLWAGPDARGPFTPVPAGAAVMSPANRNNPVVTPESGTFAWDTLTGFYKVTAAKPGCVSLDGEPTADSGSFGVPPPVVDIELVLDCRPPDTTAPTLTLTSAPSEFTNQRDARIEFAVTDDQPGSVSYCFLDGGPEMEAESGEDGVPPPELETCTSPYSVTGLSDGPHRVTLAVIDGHDNAAVQEVTFTVDTTPPVVVPDGVTEGATYPLNAPPAPTCEASDALSGLVEPCRGTVTGPQSGVGTFSYRAEATDRAGNTATATVTWRVVYGFDGFFAPVSNPPTRNRINAGRAVPIKFSLGGDRGLDVLAAGWPRSGATSCSASAPIDVVEETATPGQSTLSYDAATKTYTYVWKTEKRWA
ncbi:MAG: HYR domain-containing protein, partial [Actinobacteria bacterium]|nr:HYR domain-containing protein [Actinomycetota bacterium]